MLDGANKNYPASTLVAVSREFYSQVCSPAKREDDGDMRFVNVEQWPVTEAAS